MRLASIFIFAAFTFAVCSPAQDINGSIAGTVLDASGAGVPNAAVIIRNTDLNAVVRTAKTDHDGNYSAPLLQIGHYAVAVEVAGFKKSVKSDIELNVNDKLTINFRLEVGDVQQEVTVVANAAQVELQSPTAQNLINGTQIRELSLSSRNYEQLVALMPGVTNTSTSDGANWAMPRTSQTAADLGNSLDASVSRIIAAAGAFESISIKP